MVYADEASKATTCVGYYTGNTVSFHSQQIGDQFNSVHINTLAYWAGGKSLPTLYNSTKNNWSNGHSTYSLALPKKIKIGDSEVVVKLKGTKGKDVVDKII
ncbi:hypothetical protein ACGI6H_28085, partial [Escherichia coli]